MKLTNNSKALDFNTTDISGEKIQLSAFKGKKVILSFFRNVNCPFCNRRVHQMMLNSHKFKKADTQLILLFESSNDKISSSGFHKGIAPWPIISDPELIIYSQYGVGKSMIKMVKTMFASSLKKAQEDTKALNLPEDKDASLTLIPADFLIDEQQNITKAYYGRHLDDHIAFEELLDFAGVGK